MYESEFAELVHEWLTRGRVIVSASVSWGNQPLGAAAHQEGSAVGLVANHSHRGIPITSRLNDRQSRPPT